MIRSVFLTVPFCSCVKNLFFRVYTDNWLHSAIDQQISFSFSLFTFQLGHKIATAEKINLSYLLGENLQLKDTSLHTKQGAPTTCLTNTTQA